MHVDKIADIIHPIKFVDQYNVLLYEMVAWKPNVVLVIDFDKNLFEFFKEKQSTIKNDNMLLVAVSQKFDRNLEIEAYGVGFHSLIEENNDYILFLKLSSLLRRKATDMGNKLVIKGFLSIDQNMHKINIQGQDVHLSKNNFALFQYLAENHGRRISLNEIAMIINGGKKRMITANAIAARMSRLRKTLDQVGAGDWIQNDHGFGYYFQIPGEKKHNNEAINTFIAYSAH